MQHESAESGLLLLLFLSAPAGKKRWHPLVFLPLSSGLVQKEPNLFGIKARITDAPPLSISKFSCLYEVVVHLSLLLSVHGSIDGEICRKTVLCHSEPICRQTFTAVANQKQTISRNLSLIEE